MCVKDHCGVFPTVPGVPAWSNFSDFSGDRLRVQAPEQRQRQLVEFMATKDCAVPWTINLPLVSANPTIIDHIVRGTLDRIKILILQVNGSIIRVSLRDAFDHRNVQLRNVGHLNSTSLGWPGLPRRTMVRISPSPRSELANRPLSSAGSLPCLIYAIYISCCSLVGFDSHLLTGQSPGRAPGFLDSSPIYRTIWPIFYIIPSSIHVSPRI